VSPVNVAPKEARAILDLMGGEAPGRDVVERDFSRPRRLSARGLDSLQLTVEKSVEDLERHLTETLGRPFPVRLRAVRECTAEGLFDDHAELLVVLKATVARQRAWLVWTNAAAVGCVELLLGNGPRDKHPAARLLTRVETRLLERVLTPLGERLARSLGREFASASLVQSRDAVGSWSDVEGTPDAHRVEIELGLHGPGGESTLFLYLPGIQEEAAGADPTSPGALPGYLDRVEVDVHVRLQGCEVSLDQLLALEPGDVVPIEARLGDLARISIEGRDLAVGRLGAHRGQLAVRIESLSEGTEES